MTKVVSMFGENIKIVSENEFTKHFKWESKDIDCYLSKAYDEETDKHFLVVSIPKIQEFNAMHIQEAFVFESEIDRNDFFQSFSVDSATEFLKSLLDRMNDQIEKAKEQAESPAETETYTLQEIAEMSENKPE
jgi:hypothetical protein